MKLQVGSLGVIRGRHACGNFQIAVRSGDDLTAEEAAAAKAEWPAATVDAGPAWHDTSVAAVSLGLTERNSDPCNWGPQD